MNGNNIPHWYSKQAYRPNKFYTNTLTIDLTGGLFESFTYSRLLSDDRITPWKGFYAWYFSKKSGSYSMPFNVSDCDSKGLTVLNRKDIVRIRITVSEQK